MSDESKRFAPTPARLERARREGNVVRSTEVASVAAFVGATLAACWAVPMVAAAAIAAFVDAATRPSASDVPRPLATVAFGALVPAAAAAVAASAVALVQGGGLRVTAVKFDLKKLDPIAGLKRMVGGEAVVSVVRAVLAFAIALVAIGPLGVDVIAAGAALASPRVIAAMVAGVALRGFLSTAAVGAVFAIADYALARRRRLRSLRMSLDEVKRDAKENDGDPHARARRKSTHREIVRGAIGRVREASFVVVNPTHVAVALRYAPPEIPVPEILVRALDEAALQVRALAREHGIPVVEDVALARLLHASGASGRAIPPESYLAVATVIAELASAGLLA